MPKRPPKNRPIRVFADTNLFLRYLTNDIPQDADAVERVLLRAVAGEIILVTTTLVIAEIVWTLESFYRLPRKDVHEKILSILNTQGIEVEHVDFILQAITWYAEENVDFIDAYNAAWLLANGIKVAYTFDRKHFSRFEGFIVRLPGEN
jgi:predicted nucleic-acid-binding protein